MPPRLKDQPTLECPACGCTNPLGRLLCSRCGERLNFEAVDLSEVAKNKKKMGRRPLRNALISFVVVWGLVTLLLALWPFGVLGQPGDARRASEARAAFLRMEQALANGGQVAPLPLTELALNSYFLERGGEARELRVEIEADRVVAVARENMGPLVRSSRVVLSRDESTLPFRVESVWWGHLPLPRARALPVARGVISRFDLEVSPEMLDSLVVHDAQRNRVMLGTHKTRDD